MTLTSAGRQYHWDLWKHSRRASVQPGGRTALSEPPAACACIGYGLASSRDNPEDCPTPFCQAAKLERNAKRARPGPDGQDMTNDVTRILSEMEHGDPEAGARL